MKRAKYNMTRNKRYWAWYLQQRRKGRGGETNLLDDLDFTEWTETDETDVTVIAPDEFDTTDEGGVYLEDVVIVGNSYELDLTVVVTGTEVEVFNDSTGEAVNFIIVGSGKKKFVAKTDTILLKNKGAGKTKVVKINLNKIDPLPWYVPPVGDGINIVMVEDYTPPIGDSVDIIMTA